MQNTVIAKRPSPEPGLTSPVLIVGIAAAAGIVAYKLLNRRHGHSRRGQDRPKRNTSHQAWTQDRARSQSWGGDPQYEADQRAGLRSHAEGYAV